MSANESAGGRARPDSGIRRSAPAAPVVAAGALALAGQDPRCGTEASTAFASWLGLRYPISQAPIGSAAGEALAAAVAKAGGLGALAATWMSPGDAATAVRNVRHQAPLGVFQANFVLSYTPHALDTVLDAGVPIVTFSWGRAGDLITRAQRAGARVGVQVASCEAAHDALDSGADFLICQGVEAGGHVQASRPLRDVLAEVLAEVRAQASAVPVVVAGGVGDGRAIAAMLAAGASGAMLGTRFVATRESAAHPAYKRAIVEAMAHESVLTVCFDGTWPYAAHRVLRNTTLRQWEAAGSPPRGRRPGEGDIIAHRQNGDAVPRYDDSAPLGTMTGNISAMALYAGTSCADVLDIPTVAALLPRLWDECCRSLATRAPA